MKVIILFVFGLILISPEIRGQKNLTREEILTDWRNTRNKTGDSAAIVQSNASLNDYLSRLVDSLQTRQVDSILIFTTAFPGWISLNPCDSFPFPITSFVIFCKNRSVHIYKIQGNCFSQTVSSDFLRLFEFYMNHSPALKSEFFMPVILSAQSGKNNSITYTMQLIDHEPNYSFYYKVKNDSRSFDFAESFLENRESLFRDYNLKLAAYQWWKIIKEELMNQNIYN